MGEDPHLVSRVFGNVEEKSKGFRLAYPALRRFSLAFSMSGGLFTGKSR